MGILLGDYVKVISPFEGEVPSDLPLSVGDVIKITDVIDDNWVTGQKVGANASPGNFPVTFVEHLVLPSIRTGQKVFLVLEDFPAEQSGDLDLTKGDIILGTEPVDAAWWKGKNGPLKGIFPLSFVTEIELDCGPRSRSASSRSNSLVSGFYKDSPDKEYGGFAGLKVPFFARALVDISPQLDGELAFQLGDLIEITDVIDGDWFYGRCHNKEGLVSAVCVEILEAADDTFGNRKDEDGQIFHPVPPSYGGEKRHG
ncbi:unnamed protein product, partial [Lymnaea stagnalis]